MPIAFLKRFFKYLSLIFAIINYLPTDARVYMLNITVKTLRQ